MNYKIYIHDLPSKYNLDLLPTYINNKDIVNNINVHNYSDNKYLRSQYSLEIYLHNLIINSKYLSNNIIDANIIFIPIYLFLLAWKEKFVYNVNNIINNINELMPIINNYLLQDKIILLCYSDVMWEDERCFINYFNFNNKNVIFISYEKIIDKYLNKQISVPYITHIKQIPEQYDIKYTDKNNLICYTGRQRKELDYFKNIIILDTSIYQEDKTQWISYNDIKLYDTIDKLYSECYFSLQPHGDKQTRKGFYHSLLLGCIPVIFENNYNIYESIFKDIIDINDICIIIKNNEILNIENILNNIILNKNNDSFIPSIKNMFNSINKIKHLLLYPDNNNIYIEYIINNINDIIN
jgi:hypothetical protein